MVRMPNRSETPKRVQDLEKDLQKFVASVARSFQKSADSVFQRVMDAVAAMFWTRTDSDNRFAFKSHQHDGGDIVSGTVVRPTNNSSSQSNQFLGGSFTGTTGTFSGAVSGASGSFAGETTSTTGFTSPGVRNRTLSTNYAAVYVDGNGVIGIVPSVASKKNILGDYAVDMTKWLALPIRRYTYKDDTVGTVRIGFIADDLAAAGLTEFVQYDTDGKLQGLRVDQLLYGLMSAYTQSRTATLAEFNKRMVQTFTNSSMAALGINAEKTYDVVWPKEFADTNYAVTASVTSAGAALGALCALVPGSKTTKGCKVSVRSLGIALLANNTLTVEAIHV